MDCHGLTFHQISLIDEVVRLIPNDLLDMLSIRAQLSRFTDAVPKVQYALQDIRIRSDGNDSIENGEETILVVIPVGRGQETLGGCDSSIL